MLILLELVLQVKRGINGLFNTYNRFNKSGLNNAQTVNSDQVLYNRIKESGDSKEQLRKAATEFESIFVTKMLSEMDKTVDHENGLFGKESQYVDTFKSIVYQQMGRDIANNPRTSFGFADQIYRQMEKYAN